MSTSIFHIDTFTVPCQHIREYPGATLAADDPSRLLSVKRYTPSHRNAGAGEPITVLAAGGNGIPKELYEPFWEDFVSQSTSHGISIRAIFIADMAHQGQSGILNHGKLGDDPSWLDHARDLLQVVNHFRDEMIAPIVGIGHSIGATSLIALSAFHPRLFSRLLLIEPILGDCTREGIFYANHTINKPSRWASREDAASYAKTTAPFSLWDPRVVECWLTHGLTPSPNSNEAVDLVTSRDQEAITYVRQLTPSKTCGNPPDYDKSVDEGRSFYCPAATITMDTRVPELRPPVHYLFGGKSSMSPPTKREALLNNTGRGVGGSGGLEAVKSDVLPEFSHLVPFESPSRCADVLVRTIAPALARQTHQPRASSFDPKTCKLSEEWKALVANEARSLKKSKYYKL